MKVRIVSKKLLALTLCFAMLLSCMVWSGVSAALADGQIAYADYSTMPQKSGADAYSSSGGGNNYVGADASATVTTGADGYITLKYLNNGATATPAFRYFPNELASGYSSDFKLSANTYYVSFKYKVINAPVAATLKSYVTSKGWSNGDPAAGWASPLNLTIAAGTTHTEWQTYYYTFTHTGSTNGFHFALWDADDTACAGLEVQMTDILISTKPIIEVTNTQDYEKLAVDTSVMLRRTGTVSSEKNHTPGGSQSAKIYMEDNSGVYRAQMALLNSTGAPMQVETGKQYNVSMWVYVVPYDEAETSVNLNLWLCSATSAAALNNKSGAEYDPGNQTIAAGQWVEVTFNTAAISKGTYLICGITTSDANSKKRYVYVDDVAVTEYDPAAPVTFDYGYESKTETVNGAVGESIPFPTNPTRSGYTFGGWNTKADGSGNLVTAATFTDTAVTYYAIWLQQNDRIASVDYSTMPQKGTADAYSNAGGGNNYVGADAAATVTTGADGYITLKYLNNGATVTPGFRYFPNEYASGYASDFKLKANTAYHVSFKYKVINAPVAATLKSYVTSFGWANGTPGAGWSSPLNLTIEAGTTHTEWQTYSYTFTTGGGNGYHFALWDADDTACAGLEVQMTDIVISAPTAVTLNYGYDSKAETVYGVAGEAIPFPAAPTRSGYTFEGWSTQADGSGTLVTAASFTTTATTYYAVWEEIANTQDYEKLAVGTGVMVKGTGAVSDEQNHTVGGSRSAKIAMTVNAGTGRGQMALLDSSGAPMQVETGKRYNVSMWVYVVPYDEAETSVDLNVWVCSATAAAALSNKSGAEYDPGNQTIAAGRWVEVTFNTAAISKGTYLICGITTSDANSKNRYVYVDDVAVTEYVPASPVTTFNGGLLYTGGKVGSLSGEQGSAVYMVGDTQYAAMRIAADYTCVDNDPTKVTYDNATWTVVGRGVLLNYSTTAGAGGTPTVDNCQMQNYVTGDALKSYWSLEDNALRYSVLVKNVNQEKAEGLYLTYRSYMVITDGTSEVTVYGNTVSDVTVEKLYNAATQQGVSVKWFGE